MGDEVAFAPLIGFVAAGDEVDGDASAAAQVVERGGLAAHECRLHDPGRWAISTFSRRVEWSTVAAIAHPSGPTAP